MRFYITTPIYYVSDVPHIGHAYTTIVCDALARYHRLRGDDTWYLTGTDEHGQKIARMAEKAEVTPRQYADKFADAYKATWKALEISNDDFIRTTDPDHEATVQQLWRAMEKNGYIYEGQYEGLYCVACERFYTDKELVDGKLCPDHKTPVELIKEPSYYFALSKLTDRLLEHYQAHPEFIQPTNRRNEMVAFVREGLRDLSISRTAFAWGVPTPGGDRVIWVWLDALCNYYSATRRSERLQPFWDDPASQVVHVVGKDILRFHSVFWPAFLMAAGWPLPKTVLAHGWWTIDGEKMSKTLGNVVDPLKLASDVGVDALRYHLLREIPLGPDGDFNHEAFINRYNAELANDLGNLVNRTLGMVHKYGLGPRSSETDPFGVGAMAAGVAAAMDLYQPQKALEELWRGVRAGNGYIDAQGPWKPESNRVVILGNVLELCRVLSHLLEPFLPERALAMRAQLGIDEATAWPAWSAREFAPREAAPLFPRIDDERKQALLERWRPKQTAAAAAATAAAHDAGLISFAEFGKLDLRVAKIVSAEPIAKANKLYKLVVDLGEMQRQVVAGIAEAYKPEELVGKRVIFVANLKPATIRGVESQGMILAAGDKGVLALSALDREVPPGTKVR